MTSLNGAVNWTGGFSRNNTVDVDVLWNSGTETHEVNLILRSQPFDVTVGVPFRLSLVTCTQGFAGPGAVSEAWSDFYDHRLVTSSAFPTIPELTPDGFAVLRDGAYTSLGDAGYAIASIPEPPAMGLGLIGLVGLGFAALRKK